MHSCDIKTEIYWATGKWTWVSQVTITQQDFTQIYMQSPLNNMWGSTKSPIKSSFHADNQKQLEAVARHKSLSSGYFQTTNRPRSLTFEWRCQSTLFSSILTICPPLGHSCFEGAVVFAFPLLRVHSQTAGCGLHSLLHRHGSHHGHQRPPCYSSWLSSHLNHWVARLGQGFRDKQNPRNNPCSCLTPVPLSVGRICDPEEILPSWSCYVRWCFGSNCVSPTHMLTS